MFGRIKCCASTSRVNAIQVAVKYQYGKIEIGMPVFMDDITAVGTADDIRKVIQNCKRIEIEKKIMYGLKKTEYMIINTGKEPEEVIEERVKEGIVQETDVIGAKHQVGKAEIRVKLKLYETCLLPALQCGLKVWGK